MNEFEMIKYDIKRLISEEEAISLSNKLKDIVKSGQTTRDPQCPKSEAIHGHPVFDELLEKLLPQIEQATGKKLYPTYAYARYYNPGEELHLHLDRPACEYSATLTLDFEGDVWPILVGDPVSGNFETDIPLNIKHVNLKRGEAVVYKGCEKYHWREVYTQGSWQTQVFLHYVDQNGPYADQKYDGRKQLSHHKTESSPKLINDTYFSYENYITPQAAKKIIETIDKNNKEECLIGGGVLDKSVRDAKRVLLPVYKGISANMVGTGIYVNKEYYNFDIKGSNQSEFLSYDKNGHFNEHIDTMINPLMDVTRKLTVLLFLNDEFEGGKLFLKIGSEKIYPPQKPGDLVIFPSFILHGVEPVISGRRCSLVTWLEGPWFK